MRRGFTLIEMTVVLLIIAIVTHLAMRQLGSVRDQKLVTVANRQLLEIRDSVFCCGCDGTPTGFLADMGRLVVATNGTLSELWQKPAGARPFAVRPAVRENLAKGVSSDLISSNVFVGTGWRGPYLRLPIGKTRLMDPWGNPLENPDAAGYDRLGVTNGFAMSATHLGPTALSHDPQRQTISLVPDGGTASRLVVQVVSTSGTATNSVTYKWFGPCDGLITGACAKAVQYGVAARFEGLRPGVRTVWDSASKTARLVDIKPGDNQIEIRIP